MAKVKSLVQVTFLDRGWNAALVAMTRPANLDVEAGLLDDTSQIAQYGFYNEFGTRHIPSRSFIRSTFDEQRKKYERMVDKALRDAQLRGKPLRGGFLRIGIVMHNDIKKKITALRVPVNAPSTIRAKKSSNPLIADGIMRGAIRWRLRR
jgi:hypothetical protein